MSHDRDTLKAFCDAFQMGRAEIIDPRDEEIRGLRAEVEHLKRANQTIHDTLTAEVRALRARLGEDPDPLGLGHRGGDHG